MNDPIDPKQPMMGSLGSQGTDKARALDCVRQFMTQSKQFRQLYEYVWMRMWNEYLNARSAKANVLQRANLKLPYAWQIVETFTPQIIDAFTANTPYIKAIYRKKDFNKTMQDFADSMTQHFDYQIDQMRFFQDFVQFVKNQLIYGTAIAKVGWQKKEKILPARQTYVEDGIEKFKKIEQPVTLYEGPVFHNIDIIDFYPDWGASRPGDIQSMRGCVHRVYRTLEELEAQKKRTDPVTGETYGLYTDLDQVRQDVQKNGYNAWTESTSAQNVDWPQSYKAYAVNQYPGEKMKGKIEIWEYWGQYEVEKGKFREKVITVANGRTVIRLDDNPYDYALKPFIAGVDHPVPGEFYGEGELEPIYSMFREASALRNARLDQVNQAVNRMFIIDRNAGINVRNFYSRTSGMVLANDINGIKEMPVPEVPGSSYRELAQIDYDIQNASGIINSSQAASQLGRAFGETARGISFLQGSMNSRIAMKVKILESMVMREFGKRISILNRQFLSDDQWREINGDQPNPYKQFSAEEFYNCWDFTAIAAIDRINKEQRQAQFFQAIIPYLQMVNQAEQGTINWNKMTEKFFREFDIPDPWNYINPPEVQQQIMQRNMQMQMAAQQHEHDEKTKTLATVEGIKGQMKAERDDSAHKTKLMQTVIKGAFDVARNAGRKPERPTR